MTDNQSEPIFNDTDSTDNASEKLLKMINDYDKHVSFDFTPGSQVQGTITKIGTEFLFIDIGGKNEALMSKKEYLQDGNVEDMKTGKTIKAFVISATQNEIMLGKSLTNIDGSKQDLYSSFRNKMPVSGKVTGVSKDGLTVKIANHRAFCPISQIDIKYTENVNSFLGKKLDFLILRMSEGGKNIVVSRIPLLEQMLLQRIDELEKYIQTKESITGIISKITDFGLFVDLGLCEGLVHVSEISWERTQDPAKEFSPGQKIECIVLQISRKDPLRNTKISLSIKQLFENPWTTIKHRFSAGQSVPGKVVRIMNFGAFVELAPGIDGLLHISEMSWIKRVHHPSEMVNIGDEINVTILSIDEEKKTISLSLKDVTDDPWRNICEKFPIGSEFNGTVAQKSRFGYFIDLCEGVTGLLVFSKICPEKKDSFKVGESISVTVDSIDTANRRISLSYGITTTKDKSSDETENYSTFQKSEVRTTTEFGAALFAALHKT